TQRVKRQEIRQVETAQRAKLFKAAAILVQKDNLTRGKRMVFLQRVDRLLTDHPSAQEKIEAVMKSYKKPGASVS
ncbi:MAG: hypothetical protein ACREJN_06620, partial [Nitrospiraceae bacterium]